MKVKKDVLVFRTLPFIADSRVKRYLSLFPESENVTFKTWEKEQTVIKDVKPYPFLKRGSLIKKVFNFIGFQFFCLFSFLKLKKGDVAIFMDLDTAMLPVLFKLFNPGVVVVFDIVDPFSQTKGLKLRFLHRLIDNIEYYIALKSDLCLVPHDCRVEYYSKRKQDKRSLNYLVIENVPDFFTTEVVNLKCRTSSLTVGYFGTLDKGTRGLEELIKFASKNKGIKLLFAGDGSLRSIVEESSISNDNITYLGPYDYNELQNLYNLVDFTWAYYCPKVALHKFACPNKYFEHIMFLTPIITNTIIPQAKTISNNQGGIVINSIEDIMNNDFKEKLFHFIKYNNHNFIINTKEIREIYSRYYLEKEKELRDRLSVL